jgi:YggT family protein
VAPGFEFFAKATDWALTIYLWMMIIAILLTWVAPDPRNALVAFLNRMTAPVWRWTDRLLPQGLRAFSAYFALLMVVFLVEFLPGIIRVAGAFFAGAIPPEGVPVAIAGIFLRGLAIVLYNLLLFMVFALLAWFVLTLVNPSVNNPIVRTVFLLVDPVITPLQKVLPRMRVDLSPLVAAGLLYLAIHFGVGAILDLSREMIHAGAAPASLPGRRM